MRANSHRPGLWPGFLLVSVGGGLLARELGLLPAHVRVLDFWPLVIVVLGISVLLRASGVARAALALAFIGTGAVLLAGNLGFLSSSVTRFWPLLVVLLGLWALFRTERDRGPRPPAHGSPLPDDSGGNGLGSSCSQLDLSPGEDRLDRRYFAAGAQLRIESQAWKGGALAITAGGVELDLRQAGLDPGGATLEVRVLMGGLDIRVPDTWQVRCDVTPLLGGADDLTRSTQGVSSAPRLRVVGTVTLGGVSIQN